MAKKKSVYHGKIFWFSLAWGKPPGISIELRKISISFKQIWKKHVTWGDWCRLIPYSKLLLTACKCCWEGQHDFMKLCAVSQRWEKQQELTMLRAHIKWSLPGLPLRQRAKVIPRYNMSGLLIYCKVNWVHCLEKRMFACTFQKIWAISNVENSSHTTQVSFTHNRSNFCCPRAGQLQYIIAVFHLNPRQKAEILLMHTLLQLF